MKNVTLSLDEQLVARAQSQAAKEGTSFSRFVSDLVELRAARTLSQTEAMKAFLDGPAWPSTESGPLPTREELYDDALLRRHERPDLLEGPEEQGEAAAGDRLAGGARKP